MLSQAFEKAKKLGIIQDNPVDNATRPSLPPSKNSPFGVIELLRFMTAALEFKLHAVLMFVLATTSIRPAEAFALRWSDIDLHAGVIHVKRSVVRYKGGYTFEAPKTPRGNRAILLSPHTTYLLAAWHRNAAPGTADSLAFPNTRGEPLHGGYVYHRVFESVIDRAGLPKKRMYDLRHSHATALAADNVNPRVVSDRLGHASSTLTLDVYTGVSPEMQQTAADSTEKMFGDAYLMRHAKPRPTKALRAQQKAFDTAFWSFAGHLLGTDRPPKRLDDVLPD